MTLIKCPGCGGLFENSNGPTHAYLESSPGCWEVFGKVLAREYSDPAYFRVHRLTVDAYAVQHPGHPCAQSIQSVAIHLISLCLVFEHGIDPQRATRAMQTAAKEKSRFIWLTPPATPGAITVADLSAATDAETHCQRVRAWAAGAWRAWSAQHATIRSWLPAGF